MSSEDTGSQAGTAYCINCGEEIAADANFCPECGSKRTTGTEEGKGTQVDLNSTENDSTSFRHRLPGIEKEYTTRRNVMTGIGYTFGGFVFLGALSGDEDGDGSSGGDNSDGDSSTGSEEQYPNAWYFDDNTGIVLQNVEGTVGEVSLEISGDAINESDQSYSYVQLQFDVYDESGAKIGDALANTSGLDAGQTWRFEAISTQTENVDSFDVQDVSAY